MMVERLEELEELVALVELKLLVHSVGILETMTNWGGLSIQGYMCWSIGCNLIVVSLPLRYYLDLRMSVMVMWFY